MVRIKECDMEPLPVPINGVKRNLILQINYCLPVS